MLMISALQKPPSTVGRQQDLLGVHDKVSRDGDGIISTLGKLLVWIRWGLPARPSGVYSTGDDNTAAVMYITL